MALKDILVHVDSSPRSAERLALSVGLAARHSAHLIALYVMELANPALFYGDPSGFADVRLIDEIVQKMRESASIEARRVEQDFNERVRREGISGEWRLAEGVGSEIVALHGRYTDLVVVGQQNPDDHSGAGAAIVAGALLGTGRPLLAVPYAGKIARFGDTVLVAWKSSREAARAIHDALPLLREAHSVTILTINPEQGVGGDGDVPAADVALHLARHGVKAAAAQTFAGEISEGDALLNYADDIGADLIVAGGYGHSRLREFVFGGVTRTLLTIMTVPILLSH